MQTQNNSLCDNDPDSLLSFTKRMEFQSQSAILLLSLYTFRTNYLRQKQGKAAAVQSKDGAELWYGNVTNLNTLSK